MSLIVSNGDVGQSDDQASVAFYVVLTRARIGKLVFVSAWPFEGGSELSQAGGCHTLLVVEDESSILNEDSCLQICAQTYQLQAEPFYSAKNGTRCESNFGCFACSV